ncbi:MAG: regulatory protein RecX [Saprospiraceae bacterium]
MKRLGSRKLPSKPLTPDQVLERMERYCAYQERCPSEVAAKLREFDLPAVEAGQIYQLLQAEGFFDEKRFAEAFTRGKFRSNRWGRARIRLELLRRAIDPQLIEEALAQIDPQEYLQVLDAAIARRQTADAVERAKTAAALIRAGYEPALVFERLKIAGSDALDKDML